MLTFRPPKWPILGEGPEFLIELCKYRSPTNIGPHVAKFGDDRPSQLGEQAAKIEDERSKEDVKDRIAKQNCRLDQLRCCVAIPDEYRLQ